MPFRVTVKMNYAVHEKCLAPYVVNAHAKSAVFTVIVVFSALVCAVQISVSICLPPQPARL